MLVVGMTGAGKTTYAQAVGRRLRLPFAEMDALAFGPGWTTRAELVADVEAITRTERWIMDSYGYEQVRDIMWERADTLLWLDFSRRVILPRVLLRSARRTVLREPVFGGNREGVRGWLTLEHPVWWAWQQHGRRRAYLQERAARSLHLEVHRFRTPIEATTFLAALPAT